LSFTVDDLATESHMTEARAECQTASQGLPGWRLSKGLPHSWRQQDAETTYDKDDMGSSELEWKTYPGCEPGIPYRIELSLARAISKKPPVWTRQ